MVETNNTTQNKAQKTLVKATELPLHGNPFPPKEAVEEQPSRLELKIRSFRLAAQPYLSPVCAAYNRTGQFVSTGIAHSQGALQSISENQNTFVNMLIISTSGAIGVALSGRRGLFRKLVSGSLFIAGASVACYPKDAEQKAKLAWYIARNKLPELAKEQFAKFKSD